MPDALSTVPGLNVVQTGGPGGQTSVFMRGTNSNHVKVLIDGIDVSDPSITNGAFDFAHLLTGDIERIEVLRGPQSGLYGSDAIGGVISITTKKGEGPPKVTASVEGGSFGTFNQTAALSGVAGALQLRLQCAAFPRRPSTPVTPLDLLAPGEKRINDSYDNWTYSTKLGADLTDNLAVNLDRPLHRRQAAASPATIIVNFPRRRRRRRCRTRSATTSCSPAARRSGRCSTASSRTISASTTPINGIGISIPIPTASHRSRSVAPPITKLGER